MSTPVTISTATINYTSGTTDCQCSIETTVLSIGVTYVGTSVSLLSSDLAPDWTDDQLCAARLLAHKIERAAVPLLVARTGDEFEPLRLARPDVGLEDQLLELPVVVHVDHDSDQVLARRDSLDRVHLGLVHAVEELARVGAEGLHVAPLPLGIERVEGERGLSRPRYPGDDDQPFTRQLFMIGLLGGYTTFSSFSLQTLELAHEGRWAIAGSNVALSVVLSLAAVWLGHACGTLLRRS